MFMDAGAWRNEPLRPISTNVARFQSKWQPSAPSPAGMTDVFAYGEQPLSEPEPMFVHAPLRLGSVENPADVMDYEDLIFCTMRRTETTIFPAPEMALLPDFGARYEAVNGLCRLHYKCGSTTVALYRAITLFDKMLSSEYVECSGYHLLAAACFYIASKADDIYHASYTSIIEVTDGEFNEEDLKRAEIDVLNVTGFNITFPTPLFFLQYFLRVHPVEYNAQLLARYLTEMCMPFEEFYMWKPSEVAATALALMRVVCGMPAWTETLSDYTRYTLEDLASGIMTLYELLGKCDASSFIQRKYSTEQFCYVAKAEFPTAAMIQSLLTTDCE